MADIELVIKMPEDVFKRTVFYREFRDLNDSITTIKALEKAIQLPKEHGRLIDADDLDVTTITTDDYSGNEVLDIVLKEDVDNAPTIIEDRHNYENKEDIEL